MAAQLQDFAPQQLQDFAELHAQARFLTDSAREVAAVEEVCGGQLARAAREACAEVVDAVVARVSDPEYGVLAAAAAGLRHLDALTFLGSDVFNQLLHVDAKDVRELSYVFVVRGPAPRDPRAEQLRDFVPAVQVLRRALKPFAVRHVWDRATNRNVIRVSW